MEEVDLFKYLMDLLLKFFLLLILKSIGNNGSLIVFQGYWKDKKNIRLFMEDLGNSLKFESFQDW
jgi:hypothetical protein